jgi:hypothetical protein
MSLDIVTEDKENHKTQTSATEDNKIQDLIILKTIGTGTANSIHYRTTNYNKTDIF